MHARFSNIVIAGASAAVPEQVEEINDLLEGATREQAFILKRVSILAGLTKRHVAPDYIYAGDLAVAAAQGLMEKLAWEPESISALYFASLTPDFLTPATGSLIASALRLGKDCVITDIIDGCPGITHAALLACGLLNNENRRALIISGSVYSKAIRFNDAGNAILFGDAVGAIALEFQEGSHDISFHHYSYPDNGFAIAHYGTAYRKIDGKPRGLEMHGSKITDFCRQHIHICVKEHLKAENLQIQDVEKFYFHQPNQMILNGIAKDLDLPKTTIHSILSDYANCSGASIPLLMCEDKSEGQKLKTMFCAFGTGLRVCTMLGDWNTTDACNVIYVKSPQINL